MIYKGYHGQVCYDKEVGLFHGNVIGLRDDITFQGNLSMNLIKPS